MDTRNSFCQSSLENTLVYTLQVVPTKTNPSGIYREQILGIFDDQCGPLGPLIWTTLQYVGPLRTT